MDVPVHQPRWEYEMTIIDKACWERGCPCHDIGDEGVEVQLAQEGYGAVAPRVEPPETESGEGFESLPAPPIKQPEPEPVAWMNKGGMVHWIKHDDITIPLYTAPPKREWVGLTDEDKHYLNEVLNLQGRFPVIDAIEAKLKEKNS
jgi:hypothetical protein